MNFWRTSGLDSDFNNKLQEIYSHFLEYIIDIIKSGIDNNEFKNVDPRITALSILVNIEGIHWFTLFDKSGVEAHEYINTISNFILNGLKKRVKMNIKEILDLKIGGQWLVSPAAKETILCRENFSQEHKDIEKMVLKFAGEKIFPNVQKIEKLDEDFSRSIMEEMGNLGLIGVDAPEKYGGTELDKITACIVTEGIGFSGSSSFGCTFGVQTGIGSLGIVFLEPQNKKKIFTKAHEW